MKAAIMIKRCSCCWHLCQSPTRLNAEQNTRSRSGAPRCRFIWQRVVFSPLSSDHHLAATDRCVSRVDTLCLFQHHRDVCRTGEVTVRSGHLCCVCAVCVYNIWLQVFTPPTLLISVLTGVAEAELQVQALRGRGTVHALTNFKCIYK